MKNSVVKSIILLILMVGCNNNSKKASELIIEKKQNQVDEISQENQEEKTLIFEQQVGIDENQISTYKLIFKGINVEIIYKYLDYDEMKPEHAKLINRKIVVDGQTDEVYKLNSNELCVYNPETGNFECYEFNRSKSTHEIDVVINPEIPGYFNGQLLDKGDKIVKLNWEMEKKINLESDWDDDPRFSSNTLKVPNGKVWVLIYIDEHYYFESGLQLDLIPTLFIDNTKLNWVYKRSFSDKKSINISKSKVENIIFQSNQTIQAISNRQKSNTVGENFYQYSGEMWFLETTMNSDLQQKRNTYDLNRLKLENEAIQRDINATKRSIKAKKWKDDAEKKLLRGH